MLLMPLMVQAWLNSCILVQIILYYYIQSKYKLLEWLIKCYACNFKPERTPPIANHAHHYSYNNALNMTQSNKLY